MLVHMWLTGGNYTGFRIRSPALQSALGRALVPGGTVTEPRAIAQTAMIRGFLIKSNAVDIV